jgi:hypothetical protein
MYGGVGLGWTLAQAVSAKKPINRTAQAEN